MEDKHNVILIFFLQVVLSLLFGDCSSYHILGSKCFHLFFSGVPSFSPISSRTSIQIITMLYLYSFHTSILSHHPFVTGVLHGGSSWFNSFLKCSSRFLSKELKYLSFLLFEVQLNLHILLKWSFAFLRSSKLSNHFRLWTVITLWSWDVTYKTTTSLFFLLLIFSTTPFNPSF